MLEFDDIFTNGLTTAVYVYGSVTFLLTCISAALWQLRQPHSVVLHWKFGRA